jgi:aspartate aminotransferase
MRAAGAAAARPDAVSLAVGEPGDGPPPEAVEAARAAVERGGWGYGPVTGLPELRAAIARDQATKDGREVHPEEVLITPGGKQALHDALRCVLEPGDEVIVLAPYWPSFPQIVHWCRARPVVVPPGADLLPDPAAVEAACRPRTRALIVNSPTNPHSAVLEPERLRALAEVAERAGAWIVADQVYHDLALDGPATSLLAAAPGARERTVVVESFSKRFAMPGMRLGCAVGPRPLIEAMTRLATASSTHPNLVAQHAGLAAIGADPAWERDQLASYRRRRDLLVEALADVPGVRARRPEAGFFLLLDVREWCRGPGRPADDEDFAADLLARGGVAVTPGGAFGVPGHVRLSFGEPEEVLVEGTRRLRRYLLDG